MQDRADLGDEEALTKGEDLHVQKHQLAQRFQGSSLFLFLALGSIISALGFSWLQELVFTTPGFVYGGWMTFLTYLTFALCGWAEAAVTRSLTRHAAMKDFFVVSLLAMGGAYFTNWALNYLNYTTRIVFKSSRVLPVMAFRSLVVGAKYNAAQYGAGGILVAGIALFTSADADGIPNFSWVGIALISVALVCDALTANLEERLFFRIKAPCSHSEVMMYLSAFAAVESFAVIYMTRELQGAIEHSSKHPNVVPSICAFSVMGYVTVCFVLLIIKNFGSTNAEIVKSMRKVCQVVLSFMAFPKPMSWKYILGGLLVALSLYLLQKMGRRQASDSTEGQAFARGHGTPGHQKAVKGGLLSKD
mmetsp:Transcript_11692/g.20760  ORF Transcript_11692/g.20760 Transcript_11692/m.20760 type:complete len:361 (+) Transcript_11692:119-1201(+)|eukprot:CAMPEP_0119104686 /NCGR_PEP_ID=MMETSP1180-20130426/2834_1 /TAXON_ID=3052 ORGANISM="Chlamydomonas cf sp, Strain CCMP681" /NCGR_SAMPLE_ID=MMETSP1180 /ASSEMBLY_ACC=CAM_ASM_000741 /LENGTH=360 /DNA_ID=CAMNT_0007089511 /DNA_START=92 /DNA_END=1174 /DNA_ORIENTATION=-